jgi:hypothetical protein
MGCGGGGGNATSAAGLGRLWLVRGDLGGGFEFFGVSGGAGVVAWWGQGKRRRSVPRELVRWAGLIGLAKLLGRFWWVL